MKTIYITPHTRPDNKDFTLRREDMLYTARQQLIDIGVTNELDFITVENYEENRLTYIEDLYDLGVKKPYFPFYYLEWVFATHMNGLQLSSYEKYHKRHAFDEIQPIVKAIIVEKDLPGWPSEWTSEIQNKIDRMVDTLNYAYRRREALLTTFQLNVLVGKLLGRQTADYVRVHRN